MLGTLGGEPVVCVCPENYFQYLSQPLPDAHCMYAEAKALANHVSPQYLALVGKIQNALKVLGIPQLDPHSFGS